MRYKIFLWVVRCIIQSRTIISVPHRILCCFLILGIWVSSCSENTVLCNFRLRESHHTNIYLTRKNGFNRVKYFILNIKHSIFSYVQCLNILIILKSNERFFINPNSIIYTFVVVVVSMFPYRIRLDNRTLCCNKYHNMFLYGVEHQNKLSCDVRHQHALLTSVRYEQINITHEIYYVYGYMDSSRS